MDLGELSGLMMMGVRVSIATSEADYVSEFLPSCLGATPCAGCFCDWRGGHLSVWPNVPDLLY